MHTHHNTSVLEQAIGITKNSTHAANRRPERLRRHSLKPARLISFNIIIQEKKQPVGDRPGTLGVTT
jgi:hypothetical protein